MTANCDNIIQIFEFSDLLIRTPDDGIKAVLPFPQRLSIDFVFVVIRLNDISIVVYRVLIQSVKRNSD